MAEIFEAILASLFLKYFMGSEVNLGANAPNYNYFSCTDIWYASFCFCIVNDRGLYCSLHQRVERF